MEKNIKWKDWCSKCNKFHIVWMQPCPDCGINETPQPSENIAAKHSNTKYRCDGCDAYLDHLC